MATNKREMLTKALRGLVGDRVEYDEVNLFNTIKEWQKKEKKGEERPAFMDPVLVCCVIPNNDFSFRYLQMNIGEPNASLSSLEYEKLKMPGSYSVDYLRKIINVCHRFDTDRVKISINKEYPMTIRLNDSDIYPELDIDIVLAPRVDI